jgi:hypothetical protein
MEEDEITLREWIAGLPLESVIAWNDNGLGAGARRSFSSWLDIQVPMLETVLGWNWVWTINIDNPDWEPDPAAPADTGNGDETEIDVAPDGYALVATTPAGERVHAVACYEDGRVEPLDDEEVERVYPPDYEPPLIQGLNVALSPFLEIETIDRALADWVAKETGRTDIRFRFEAAIGPSPMLQVAIERVEEWEEAKERGEEPRRVVMEFDNPEFIADFLDCSIEDAKEHIHLSNEYGKLLRAKIARDADRAKARAERLLDRLAS